MFSEERKPGAKQFFSGLMLMLCAYTAGILLKGLFPNHVTAHAIFTIIMYCAAVYVIYIRYSAVYTYTLNKKSITAHVRAGRRCDEVSVNYNKIKRIKRGRFYCVPLSHKTFTSSLFPGRNYCCILYNNEKSALIIEVSDDFYNKLKERVK